MTFHEFMDFLACATMIVWLCVGVMALKSGYLIKVEGGTFNINDSAVTLKHGAIGTLNTNLGGIVSTRPSAPSVGEEQ